MICFPCCLIRRANISSRSVCHSIENISRLTSQNIDDMAKKDMSKRSKRKANGRRLLKLKRTHRDYDVDVIDAEYYFHNGFRKVYPYMYTYTSYAKQRWVHQTILDIIQNEFTIDETDVHKHIMEGNFTVNGRIVEPDYVVQISDLLQNRVHRHEYPVLATPIEVIAETADVLVVNKPASIPCHPCGRYKYNSLTCILHKEYGYTNLRMLYRLDRVTSGVLILPKTASTSSKMEKHVLEKQVKKEYLAKVVGKFPDGEVTCNQPLVLMSRTIFMYKSNSAGKTCSTTFQRISYNGRTSVIKCWPHTGRTHQIRVHLQFLGYPIANDHLYNNAAFGEGRGKGGVFPKSDEEIALEIWQQQNMAARLVTENPLYHKQLVLNKRHKVTGSAWDSYNTVDELNNNQSSTECIDKCHEYGKHSHWSAASIRENESMSQKLPNQNTDNMITISDNHSVKPETDCVVDKDIATPRSSIPNQNLNSHICSNAHTHDSPYSILQQSLPEFDESKVTVVEGCFGCQYLFDDPSMDTMMLYLHAVKYTGPDWEYSTALPEWAADDWLDDDS